MNRVRDLAFAHPVVVFDGGDHWSRVTALATHPLTAAGISAFIRYRDVVATRYAYLVSSWATARDGVPYVGVLAYGVDGAAPGEPPASHPSNDSRLRQVAEAYATTDDDAAERLSVSPAPAGALLWARRDPDGDLVPVAVSDGVGDVLVSPRAAGILPAGSGLLLARAGVAEALRRSPRPVTVPVHACSHRTRAKVGARVAAGRARPTAVLTVGTLEQLTAGARST